MRKTRREILLLAGDVALLYATLALTLLVRGQGLGAAWARHFWPFSLLFACWLCVFAAHDLYGERARPDSVFLGRLLSATAVNALVAVLFFYLLTDFGIAPKTNLVVYLAIFTAAFLAWRFTMARWSWGGRRPVTVSFLEVDADTAAWAKRLTADGLSDYRLGDVSATGSQRQPETDGSARLVVVGNAALREAGPHLSKLLSGGVPVVDAASFRESVDERVPLALADAAWFLDGAVGRDRGAYETGKRLLDVAIAASLGLVLAGPLLIIAAIVRATGPGPVLYWQVRLGQNSRPFRLVKFRTMVPNAEPDGPRWAETDDPRMTPVGRQLRRWHLDELPQLWNILRGEMSFIGPRPERPEFIAELATALPLYRLRLLVRPGLTGWAQTHGAYAATATEAADKLAYDLYYVRHRGFILDLSVIIKTVAVVLRGQGR